MTIQTNAQVRLVRCPRCQKLLTELPDVPVYRCGGCGTILQAKNQKNEARDRGTRSHSNEMVVSGHSNDLVQDGQGSSVKKEATLANETSLPGKSGEGDQNEFGGCNLKQLGHEFISDKIPSSTELPSHDKEETSAEATPSLMSDEEQHPLDQYNKDRYGDCDMKGPSEMSVELALSAELNQVSLSSSSEAETNMEMEGSKSPLKQHNTNDSNEIKSWRGKCPENMSSKEVASSSEIACHEIDEPSPVIGTGSDKENLERPSMFRSSRTEDFPATMPRDSIMAAERTSPESITSGESELLAQYEKNTVQGFNHIKPIDALENLSATNPRSDLSATLREFSKSSTSKSYCAYDGSVSSYDGADEGVSEMNLNLSTRNFKAADFVRAGVMSRREEFVHRQMQDQTMKSSSIPMRKRHNVLKDQNRPLDELMEPTEHRHPVGSRIKLEKDEHLSRLPFYSMGEQDGYGSDHPIHKRYMFQRCSSFHSQEKYPEPDKMELLRMVYELQNQLSGTYFSKENTNGRFPGRVAGKEKQTPLQHHRFSPEQEIYTDLSCPRYSGGYSQGQNWPQERKISQRPFSCEATHGRYGIECSCFHCSRELPPHANCSNKVWHRPYTSHSCYMPYHSNFSGPQYYPSSKFSISSHDKDQWHKDHEMKRLYSMEKNYSRKRHVRPIAGGAPMINCYLCSQLMQLPVDFLLFKRRWHRLRCNSCSKVLKFSLENRTHVVPCVADGICPPPGESDNMNHDCSHAEAVSCSDDYGKSFGRSLSTDVDLSSPALPSCTLKVNSRYGKMISNSFFEAVEDRKKPVLEEPQEKCKYQVENFTSAGYSSKLTKMRKLSSEVEELPKKTGSPLHFLLGYSSPSQVMNKRLV